MHDERICAKVEATACPAGEEAKAEEAAAKTEQTETEREEERMGTSGWAREDGLEARTT